ncbi:MAG: helix-turn-helix transcriptional regulator [Labilithrix sp.]|nr:helix-turn-helix transcriptional regulator [Labilithrix sp.]MCW5818111.1 helix-turn-helix transcriptional regulator [Labilithrix sp.]
MHEIDVDRAAAPAFGIAEDYEPFRGDWHQHDRHQLLFAARGTLVLTTEDRRWTLPPERAAWIARKVRHRVESSTGCALRTVYIAAALVKRSPPRCRVFAVTPLAREMLLYAMRWGPTGRGSPPDPTGPQKRPRKRSDPSAPQGPDVDQDLADTYFHALGALASEWIADERPYFLPVAKSAATARATAWIDEHLDEATVERAAAAAKVSVRTLSRRFEDELQTSYRSYLQSARMMRAMELLARPDASVSSTAHAVGFSSLGAFTTAFTERCGETPSAYRKRVTS